MQETRLVVIIVDRDQGRSRLLSIDDSGCRECGASGMDDLAGQVEARQPDLILVSPEAMDISGDSLARELNRLLRFRPGYRWTPAPGDVAS